MRGSEKKRLDQIRKLAVRKGIVCKFFKLLQFNLARKKTHILLSQNLAKNVKLFVLIEIILGQQNRFLWSAYA